MSTVARLADALHTYAVLAGAGVRAQLQYRASFAIRLVTDALGILADFATIALLVNRFGAVQGWTLPELALLYGMVGLSWGFVEMGLRGFEEFGQFLVAGELDRWLLRPRGLILQIAASHFEPHRLGRIGQAGLVLGAALAWLGLPAAGIAWVVAGVAGGVVFFAGVVLAGAATQFWTLGQTSELQNMLTYGGTAALSYPVSIYERWFRRILTVGIPMAFVNYYPALAALGRARGDTAATLAAWSAPFVCVAVAFAGAAIFRRGLRRYESSGT